jgi:hypothetical protein
MKNMFVRDPFDIAPKAPRQTQASWVTLAAGLLFVALCAWPLVRSMQAMKQAEAASQGARAALNARADSQRTARQRQNDPAFLEQVKAQQKLQQILRMSWSGLFDALESAAQEVRGGAVILSLVPVKTQADAAQVGITALAVSPQIMIDYIGALQKNPHVRQVELTMQQPTVKAGAHVVRFQASVLWDPRSKVAALPAPDQVQQSVQGGYIR